MFQEFPKMIYLGGDQTAEWRIVQDAGDEKALASEGFLPVGTVPTEPVKRGRKPKGEV